MAKFSNDKFNFEIDEKPVFKFLRFLIGVLLFVGYKSCQSISGLGMPAIVTSITSFLDALKF